MKINYSRNDVALPPLCPPCPPPPSLSLISRYPPNPLQTSVPSVAPLSHPLSPLSLTLYSSLLYFCCPLHSLNIFIGRIRGHGPSPRKQEVTLLGGSYWRGWCTMFTLGDFISSSFPPRFSYALQDQYSNVLSQLLPF